MLRQGWLPWALLAACSADPPQESEIMEWCSLIHGPTPLPGELQESSGILFSPSNPNLLWSHNDSGGGPMLFALDTLGALLGQFRVPGVSNRDWEDLAIGPCGEGEEVCLWMADIGDNLERRSTVSIARVPEPNPEDSRTKPGEVFTLRYPDGPRDAEAFFVGPRGEGWILTKGRSQGIEVYRTPSPLSSGPPQLLERVQVLTDRPPRPDERITGASGRPHGGVVLVRSYSTLHRLRMEGDSLRTLSPAAGWVLGLRETQGEAVDQDAKGRVVLTSEGALGGWPAVMHLLHCDFPDTSGDPQAAGEG